MNKFLLTVAVLITSSVTFAQNRLVNKADYAFRENKIDEAQGYLTEALTSGETKNMSKAWDLQGEIYQRIFSIELNKASQKQPLDTTKFEKNLFDCLNAYEECNEYDTKKEYFEKNKANIKKFRQFVYYAGVFNLQNGKYKEAYNALDKWMKYPTTYKLIEGDPSMLNDSTVDKAEVGYYACLAAYQAKDMNNVSTYLNEAMNYERDIKTVRQLHLTSLLEKGDTAEWVNVARKYAVEDEITAQNLLAHYSRSGNNQAALDFAESLIAADPENIIANYAKGVVLYESKKYEEALPFFDKCTEIDPMYVDAFYNGGLCCQRIGMSKNEEIVGKKFKTKAELDSELNKVKDWFRKAETYFVTLKDLVPDEPNRWAYQLKSIYYTLEDKEKEAEMDAYLK